MFKYLAVSLFFCLAVASTGVSASSDRTDMLDCVGRVIGAGQSGGALVTTYNTALLSNPVNTGSTDVSGATDDFVLNPFSNQPADWRLTRIGLGLIPR